MSCRTIPKVIFDSLLKYAKEGNAECQNYIGYYIIEGETPEGVEIHEDPVELIRQSAEQGWPAAQYNLGLLYEQGYYVDEDGAKAFEWYLKAAMQGSTEGMTSVGMCYYNGIGVTPDLRKALSWLNKAAMSKDARAQLLVGEIYAKDHRCQHKDKALMWFCEAAKHDLTRDAVLKKFVFVPPFYGPLPMGSISINLKDLQIDEEADWYPPYPDPMTEEEFAALLEKAKAGDVPAMCHVADCYKVGNGTEVNVEQLIYWGNRYLDAIHGETPHEE